MSKDADSATPLPPWIMYPGCGPGDGFWRQSGEAWLTHVWEPFWSALSPEEKATYHAQWQTPAEWRNFFFEDSDFKQWLDTVDNEDLPPGR